MLTALLINNGLISDSGFLAALNLLLDGSNCVVGINDFAVTPGTGLQVQIAAGYALVYSSTKTSYIPIYNDSTITQAITSNSSGSTRIDLICLKVDTTISADTAMDNVASIQYVTGTPGGGVPATPAGYEKFAEITVGNGVSSFSTGDIADKRTNLVSRISLLNAIQQAITPANPATGLMKLYFKTDGNLYSLSPAGTETQIGANNIWIPSSDSYTYVDANTMKITGLDRRSTFKKGTRIKLTNSTTKYFTCNADATLSGSDTLVKVYGGTDFTLANTAISSVSYSYGNPPDHPYAFVDTNLTATPGGSLTLSSLSYPKQKVIINKNYVRIFFNLAAIEGGSGSPNIQLNIPSLIAMAASLTGDCYGSVQVNEGGTLKAGFMSKSSTTAILLHKYDNSNFLTGGGSLDSGAIVDYEI